MPGYLLGSGPQPITSTKYAEGNSPTDSLLDSFNFHSPVKLVRPSDALGILGETVAISVCGLATPFTKSVLLCPSHHE
jgi:hypothetical protein